MQLIMACLRTAKVVEFSWRKTLLDHASVLCTEICSELTSLRSWALGVALRSCSRKSQQAGGAALKFDGSTANIGDTFLSGYTLPSLPTAEQPRNDLFQLDRPHD